MANDVLTVEELKREVPYDAASLGMTDAEYQAVIEKAGDAAVERVTEWVGGDLTRSTTTETLARPPNVPATDLPLSNVPVSDVSAVSIDTWRVDGADVEIAETVVTPTHLELTPDAERDAWPTKRRSIEVTYTHGLDDVPGPVEEAIVRLTRRRLHNQYADGVTSESIDGSTSYESDQALLRAIRNDVKQFEVDSYYEGAMLI
ncbi:hypothetical protein Z052_02030 [Halorubrum sp. C191]|uniref:hypothetical protein n=1 Tax=Halorubrum sp. C191 TaxID=1383842 RepID=UPI000C07EF00|nr:hypothetical protein [Halorubrum sp. C191]PHQ43941.1 hypothetical protein Z052_02030 [Halorubrum sp. C191]